MSEYTVNAKQCIWFRYGVVNIFGENGSDYLPLVVPVPEECSSISIKASGWWSYQNNVPNTWSGPDGSAAAVLSQGPYILLLPNRSNTLKAKPSTLVCCAIYEDDPTDEHEFFIVGSEFSLALISSVPIKQLSGSLRQSRAGAVTRKKPLDKIPKELVFGMHDAFKWTDCEGSVQMSIEFS
jgi:hypothetical protein